MQYLENTGLSVPTDTESCLMDTSHDQAHYTREQQLLMEIRDKLCGGNASRLAREIGRDPTYVNRLFYPEGKAGRKGIGLEIMQATLQAFQLPLHFWSLTPPAIPEKFAQNYLSLKAARDRAAHGIGPGPFSGKWADPNYSPQGPIISDEAHVSREPVSAEEAMEFFAAAAGRPIITAAPRRSYGLEPILAWEHPEDLPENAPGPMPCTARSRAAFRLR